MSVDQLNTLPVAEVSKEKPVPSIAHVHATTWHDGSAAFLTPSGKIYAISAERVGDRYKHSWNSELAYAHLKDVLAPELEDGIDQDNFVPTLEAGLETTGHHYYHAASTYYGSGYRDAAILIVDGQGPENNRRSSTSIWYGQENQIHLLEMPNLTEGLFAPQSIGHFYTAIGALAGMQELHEEGKTMGLASYGKPSKYLDFFRQYVQTDSSGNYAVDSNFIFATLGNTFGPAYFGWGEQPSEIQAIWNKFMELRGSPIRKKGEDVTQDDADIAYAGQIILEDVMLGLAHRAKEATRSNHLCLAGGVALNSVANGKILESGLFEDIFIFPAAGDDGQAIGKLFVDIKRQSLTVDLTTHNAYFGPEYSLEHIDRAIAAHPEFARLPLEDDELISEVAQRIAEGHVIGWFQGGSELGPRALGHRSILADPRNPNMRHYINAEVKHRELYRPFAPVVLEEKVEEYFDLKTPSPYMLLVANVHHNKRNLLPAITHVDGTARVQTINRNQDAKYYDLVKAFGELTGTPILLNTSFNDKGEPIVETPENALQSFGNMKLDALVLGNNLIVKMPDTTTQVIQTAPRPRSGN